MRAIFVVLVFLAAGPLAADDLEALAEGVDGRTWPGGATFIRIRSSAIESIAQRRWWPIT